MRSAYEAHQIKKHRRNQNLKEIDYDNLTLDSHLMEAVSTRTYNSLARVIQLPKYSCRALVGYLHSIGGIGQIRIKNPQIKAFGDKSIQEIVQLVEALANRGDITPDLAASVLNNATFELKTVSLGAVRERVYSINFRYGGTEERHHIRWLLDQTLQLVLGRDEYNKFIDEFNNYRDVNGEAYPPWDKGIAP